MVDEVQLNSITPTEPVITDDQSVDGWRYVDIKDKFTLCGLHFLQFAWISLPPILFAKSAPTMVISLPASMSALSRCFLYLTVMLIGVDRFCIGRTC